MRNTRTETGGALTRTAIQRYSRQLLVPGITEASQHSLATANVAIVGLGGLGGLAARYLVGAGVGHLHLIDGDRVTLSNLHRQTLYTSQHIGQFKTIAAEQALSSINPDSSLSFNNTFVSSKHLLQKIQDFDCVLDCSDSVDTRLAINAACITHHVPLFIAAASGTTWQSINLHTSQKTHGCYACLTSSIDVNEDCMTKGILGPVVGMAASHQANQALLYLTNKDTMDNWGTYLNVDARTGVTSRFTLSPSPYCEVCQ
jgi:sulfur carrier protein ThiS adenylyltransferase